MVSVSDIVAALRELKEWARLQTLPKEVDALKERVNTLEEVVRCLTEEPVDQEAQCPRCHRKMTFQGEQPDPTFGMFGARIETWKCDSCGHVRPIQRNPAS